MKEMQHRFGIIQRRGAVLVLLAALCTMFLSVKALASVGVRNVEWEDSGRVEVHFQSAVEYGNVRVTVRDRAGKKHCAKILDKDKDELEFRAKGLKAGKTYSVRIRGIRRKGTSKYGTAKGSFTVPRKVHGITMYETDIDPTKETVSFEFLEDVEWKSEAVSISDGTTEYVQAIREKNSHTIKVKTGRLEAGKWYDWKISGIRRKGRTRYVTLKGRFKAY